MFAAALGAIPYVHRTMTPLAFATGAVILTAGGLTVAVASVGPTVEWRWAWLLAASLCLLLAVDEAFPLDEWVSRATGLRWWLVYAIPVVIGVRGWLRAMPLLKRELPSRSRPVVLLQLGNLAWIAAYGARIGALLNDHALAPRIVSQIMFLFEAVLKLGGGALWTFALAGVFVRLTRGAEPLKEPKAGRRLGRCS